MFQIIQDVQQQVNFIQAIGFEKLASLVINKVSFIQILSTIRNSDRREFIDSLGFDKLASLVISADYKLRKSAVFNSIAVAIQDTYQRQAFIEAISVDKLISWVTDSETFFETASHISDEKQNRDFVEKLGLNKLIPFVRNAFTFRKIVSIIRDEKQNRDFIKALDVEKLVSFVKNRTEFRTIASKIRDAVQNRDFVTTVSLERLASFVTNRGSFLDIMQNIEDITQRQQFVESIMLKIMLKGLKEPQSVEIYQALIEYCLIAEQHGKIDFPSVLKIGLDTLLQNAGDPSVLYSACSKENQQELFDRISLLEKEKEESASHQGSLSSSIFSSLYGDSLSENTVSKGKLNKK
jgi:hypothetical protein